MTESLFSTSDFIDLLGDDSPTETCNVDLGVTFVEDLKARKKAKHREAMVEFRLNKKQKQKKLVAEHHRLEREMKALVGGMRAAAACSGGSADALRELAAERETLRCQNMALQKEVKRYEKFQKLVLEASQDPIERDESNLLQNDEEAGWRVNFDGGEETSFYFHPFTRDEVDVAMREFESELESGMPSLSRAGTFFGWEVYSAPLVASASDSTRLVARTRVTKRLKCSLDVHTQMSYTKQKDLSPMIVTPIGWGLHQRGKPAR